MVRTGDTGREDKDDIQPSQEKEALVGKKRRESGKREGVSREKGKARNGKKGRRESVTKNTGKGKGVRQLTSWLGSSPKFSAVCQNANANKLRSVSF